MTIRKARLDDLNELFVVFEETIRSICNRDYSDEQINAWFCSGRNKEKWEKKIINQFFFIVIIDNKITGFGSLEENYLDMLYVHKNFLRKGISKLIFKNIKEEAIKKARKEIIADVSITAFPFFKKMGFKCEKENKFYLNGIAISNYRMVLDLKENISQKKK